mgnify:FL=1
MAFPKSPTGLLFYRSAVLFGSWGARPANQEPEVSHGGL